MSVGTTLIYAAVAGITPSLIWLFFWLREDAEHSEPRSLLTLTFIGGMVAVIGAIVIEKVLADFVGNTTVLYVLWASAEEILKFLAVLVIALGSDYYDEPIDAMIYCITVALGFAAIENMFFALEPLSSGYIAQSIINGNLRFIGATLVHTISSGIVGFALGWAFYRSKFSKFIAVSIGLIAAITIHTSFNIALVNAEIGDTLKAFAWIWGAVVLLIVLFEEIKAVKPKFLFK